jgi:hypothetical protein
MSDSSPTDPLACVTPRQILTLLDLLRGSDWRQRDFVESRYRAVARNFDVTLAFLERLQWLRIKATRIEPMSDRLAMVFESPATSAIRLLDALLECPGAHRPQLVSFLNRFELQDGALACALHGEASLAAAAARDFLMDLGAVARDADSKNYVLDQAFVGAFLEARTLRAPSSIKAEELQDRREDLGLRAERAVLDFERNRVGPDWAGCVRHVSRDRPFACYDVLSVTIERLATIPRYIEVKAVSPDSPEFHWSTAEIEASQVLRDRYFLYLVPVAGPDEFDLARLTIISDPFVSIYQSDVQWTKQPTHFLCRPARPTTS